MSSKFEYLRFSMVVKVRVKTETRSNKNSSYDQCGNTAVKKSGNIMVIRTAEGQSREIKFDFKGSTETVIDDDVRELTLYGPDYNFGDTKYIDREMLESIVEIKCLSSHEYMTKDPSTDDLVVIPIELLKLSFKIGHRSIVIDINEEVIQKFRFSKYHDNSTVPCQILFHIKMSGQIRPDENKEFGLSINAMTICRNDDRFTFGLDTEAVNFLPGYNAWEALCGFDYSYEDDTPLINEDILKSITSVLNINMDISGTETYPVKMIAMYYRNDYESRFIEIPGVTFDFPEDDPDTSVGINIPDDIRNELITYADTFSEILDDPDFEYMDNTLDRMKDLATKFVNYIREIL